MMALAIATAPVQAAIQPLLIGLDGVNIRYDGTNLVDADGGGADPDPLNSASFKDGPEFGNLIGTLSTDVTMDLLVPNVTGIKADGSNEVLSAAGGTLVLRQGVNIFLALELTEAIVDYDVISIPAFSTSVRLTFIGAAAEIDSQALPFGLVLGEPVSVTFSMPTVTSITQTGGPNSELTGFRAAGTGDIQGVPEPASLGLLGMGALAIARRRRRA